MCVCVCVCVCVRARACVRACVCVCAESLHGPKVQGRFGRKALVCWSRARVSQIEGHIEVDPID